MSVPLDERRGATWQAWGDVKSWGLKGGEEQDPVRLGMLARCMKTSQIPLYSCKWYAHPFTLIYRVSTTHKVDTQETLPLCPPEAALSLWVACLAGVGRWQVGEVKWGVCIEPIMKPGPTWTSGRVLWGNSEKGLNRYLKTISQEAGVLIHQLPGIAGVDSSQGVSFLDHPSRCTGVTETQTLMAGSLWGHTAGYHVLALIHIYAYVEIQGECS